MDYQINPPTKGFTLFELRRRAYSDTVEVVVMDSSYEMTLAVVAEWLSKVGYPNGSKVLDVLHNCRRIECTLDPPGFRVNHDPVEVSEESEEIEMIMDSALGLRIPFQPEYVSSPFDQPDWLTLRHSRMSSRRPFHGQ